jgi:antitoxin component of RelBE/YafQ-DinJ toxin-antitoxin module
MSRGKWQTILTDVIQCDTLLHVKKDDKVPEFKTLEEEREYWEARGPLAPGNRGRTYNPVPGEKHSSFLAVRMTGKEISQLRQLAAKQGVGVSTYARMLLTKAIEEQTEPEVTLTELKELIESLIDRTPSAAPARAGEKKTRYKA